MQENMTLTEFLNYFEFNYCLYDDGTQKQIGLVDELNANLGDIEAERYELSKQGVMNIIDRLDIYYNDYIFKGLEETLEHEHDICTKNMNWKDLYRKTKELGLDYDMDIMPYIFAERELIRDFADKEVKLDL